MNKNKSDIMNRDEKALLVEQFKVLHVKIDSEFEIVNNRLKTIEEQVTKTNSRVTHNEKDIIDLKLEDKNHVIRCPVAPKLEDFKDEIRKDFEDINFFIRHPKLGVALLTAFIFIFIGSGIAFLNAFKKDVDELNASDKIRIENTK